MLRTTGITHQRCIFHTSFPLQRARVFNPKDLHHGSRPHPSALNEHGMGGVEVGLFSPRS